MSLIKTGPLAHFDCGSDCDIANARSLRKGWHPRTVEKIMRRQVLLRVVRKQPKASLSLLRFVVRDALGYWVATSTIKRDLTILRKGEHIA